MKKICSIPVFLVILAFLSQGTVHSQSPATFDLEVDSSPFQTTPSDFASTLRSYYFVGEQISILLMAFQMELLSRISLQVKLNF